MVVGGARYGAAEVYSFSPDYDRFPLFATADCYLDDVSCWTGVPTANCAQSMPLHC